MRILRELAVIVLGVLIALAARAAYGTRADRAQEAIYLSELRLDVERSLNEAGSAFERSAFQELWLIPIFPRSLSGPVLDFREAWYG